METRENYLERIGSTDVNDCLGERVFIGGTSCIDTIVVTPGNEGDYIVIEEELHIAVLVRDLGTRTPYRELGRGRP